MPHTQIVDEKNKLVLTTFTRRVDGQEVMEAYTRLYLKLRTGPEYHHLWDCRFIDLLALDRTSIDGLKHLAETFCPRNDEQLGKFAIVASCDPVYECATSILTSTGTRKREKHVFRALNEALSWLSIKRLPSHFLN